MSTKTSQTPQTATFHPDVTTCNSCRLCGGARLIDLFSLGEQYVSDFVAKEHVHDGVRCPIDLVLCSECTLAQLRHTAPQEFLYTRHYHYRSGVTRTMRDALRDVVDAALQRVHLEVGDIVLDIGANDGTLLSFIPDGRVKVACEPANNMQESLGKVADVVIHDFWSVEAYRKCVGEGEGSDDE